MMRLRPKALGRNFKITRLRNLSKRPISSVLLKEVPNNLKLQRRTLVTVFLNPRKTSQPENLTTSSSPSLKARPPGTSTASGQLIWRLTLRN